MTKLFKNLLILSVLCFASNSMANDSSTFGTEDEGMPSALSDILFGGEDVSESQKTSFHQMVYQLHQPIWRIHP